MHNPLLYRELHSQLSQWIHPKDKRHLQGFAENVAAILQSQSGCLSHWRQSRLSNIVPFWKALSLFYPLAFPLLYWLTEALNIVSYAVGSTKKIGLPAYSPPKAFASIRKRDFLETRIEFSRVSILAP